MERYRYNRVCRCTRCRARGILWPTILITMGFLILLDNLGVHGTGFHRTWPLILIIGGLARVFQNTAPTDGHIDLSPPQASGGRGDAPPVEQAPPSNEVSNV